MPISVQDLIRQEADKQGVPSALALAVAEQESGFNPTVTGPKLPSGAQAIGTFQLLPDTAKTLGVDPNDPQQNITGGVKYLRQLMDQHNGDLNKVLADYGGARTDQTYVPGVMGRIKKFQTPTGVPTPSTAPTPPPQPRSWATSDLASRGPSAYGRGDAMSAVLSGFDPRTPTGRVNLAGAAGSVALTAAAPELALPAWAARIMGVAVPATGAYLGGAIEKGGEAAVAGQTPSAADVTGAGREQATMELAGQALAWPLKVAGRHLFSYGVSKRVAKGLEDLQRSTGVDLESALQSARDAVASLKAGARQQVLRAKTAAASRIEAARTRLRMAAPAVTPAQTGRMTQEVIAGPAQHSLDALGQTVQAAAESGPDLPVGPLRDRLEQLREQITPSVSHQPGQLTGDAAALQQQMPGFSPEQALAVAQRNPEVAAELARRGAVEALPPDHPLPGVLSKVDTILGQAEEQGGQLPYRDAHLIKTQLDQAVNWDRRSRKTAESLTKGFRGTLRDLMSSHEPYNQATAAYQTAVQPFTRGIAPQLRKVAISNPESLIELVKGTQPTQLNMLHDLLFDRATEGGGQAEGQAAWNALRASWTHKNLIQGGPEKILDRIDKLDPDFVQTMYGDAQGSTVLQNLRQIGQAFRDAVAQGKLDVAQTRVTGAEAVAGATRAVQRFRAGAQPLREQMEGMGTAFRRSSIGPANVPQPWETVSTAGHVAFFPHSPFTPMRIGRAVTHGARVNDLIYWSAITPGATQFLVKHVLTGPNPGQALANFGRWVAAGQPEPAPSHEPTTGAPPPVPGSLATPPPAPSR